MTALVVAACLGAAVACGFRPGGSRPRVPTRVGRPRDDGWMRRRRPLWSALAGLAAVVVVSPPVGWVAGVLASAAIWTIIGRSESPAERRAREAARRELPHVVGLLADALRAGQAPVDALELVADALPGPASDRLAAVVPRLRLGLDPQAVWADLAADPAIAPLGRTLERTRTTGGSVAVSVERLAESLAEDARGTVEDRARAVGVKAALPLGLCLLPSFVLLGIVPVVAGMLGTLGL